MAGAGISTDPAEAESSPTSEQIIDATLRLLETRNLREISVADILTESGFARGTFYLWFDNKYDAAGKAYRRSSIGVEAAARSLFASVDDGVDHDEARARIDRVFAELVASWRDYGHVLRAVNDSWRTEPSMANHWVPAYNWVQHSTAKLIAGVRERTVSTGRDRVLASALINMNEHTLYQASLGVDFTLEAIQPVLADVWFETIFANV
ncbi:MAG: TetR/AcrR family transcriptional regulator [Actinomycetota bacterium]